MEYEIIKDYGNNIVIVANADNMVNVWLKDSNKLVSPTIWFDKIEYCGNTPHFCVLKDFKYNFIDLEGNLLFPWLDNVRRENANVYKIAYHNANNYDRFDFVFLHNDEVSLLSYNTWFSLVEDLIHEQVHIWKTNIKYPQFNELNINELERLLPKSLSVKVEYEYLYFDLFNVHIGDINGNFHIVANTKTMEFSIQQFSPIGGNIMTSDNLSNELLIYFRASISNIIRDTFFPNDFWAITSMVK